MEIDDIDVDKKPYICQCCNAVFPYKSGLKRHAKVHTDEEATRKQTDEKPFLCELCNRLFTRSDNLNRHLKTHEKQRRFTCNVCDAMFVHEGRLDVHKTIHVGDKPLMVGKSPKPNFVIVSRSVADQEKNYMEKIGAVGAGDCARRLSPKTNSDQSRDVDMTTKIKQLYVRSIARSTEDIRQCTDVDDAMSKEQTAVEKINPAHSEHTTDGSLRSVNPTELPCNSVNLGQETDGKTTNDKVVECSRSNQCREQGRDTFGEGTTEQASVRETYVQVQRSSLVLDSHLRTCSAAQANVQQPTAQSIQSTGPSAEFQERTSDDRKNRTRSRHLHALVSATTTTAVSQLDKEVRKRFTCGVCHSVFEQEDTLNIHEQTHKSHHKKTSSCELCVKSFARRSDLNRHLKTHANVRGFNCDPSPFEHETRLDTQTTTVHTSGEQSEVFRCDRCRRVYLRTASLDRHVKNANTSVRFTCGICPQKFSSENQLRLHARTHAGKAFDGKFSDLVRLGLPRKRLECYVKIRKLEITSLDCKLCSGSISTRLSTRRTLDSHVRRKLKETSGSHNMQLLALEEAGTDEVTCTAGHVGVTRSTAVKSSLSVRSNTHQAGKKPAFFACLLCSAAFSRKDYLCKHVQIHSGEKPFKCDVCKVSFLRKHALNKHMKSHAGDKPRRPAAFGTKDVLKCHFGTRTDLQMFECTACRRKFAQKYQLNQHAKIHTGEKPFGCECCGVRFLRKSALCRHATIHTAEKPFKCKRCNVAFKLKDSLHRHGRTHSDTNKHECKVCCKRFAQKYQLSTHLKTHTGEKPFACKICSAVFTRLDTLRKHLRAHAIGRRFGECNKSQTCYGPMLVPFGCELCKRQFASKTALNSHTKTHTGENQFKCRLCNVSFTHVHRLAYHMRTGSDKKPHGCKLCKKAFLLENTLNEHVRNHTGEKPFTCTECNSSFKLKRKLLTHLKEHLLD